MYAKKMYFIDFLLRLYKMLILLSLNSYKIITYHFGIEITLTKTVNKQVCRIFYYHFFPGSILNTHHP